LIFHDEDSRGPRLGVLNSGHSAESDTPNNARRTYVSDPVHDKFAGWALGFAPYGGADVGEIQYLATKVKPGDDDSFFDEFSAFAKRRIEEGDTAAAKGHAAAARDCYLRAACLLGVAYHPIFGKPVDPRLVDAFHLQVATFDKAMASGRQCARGYR
jgi:hypothetical protein